MKRKLHKPFSKCSDFGKLTFSRHFYFSDDTIIIISFYQRYLSSEKIKNGG